MPATAVPITARASSPIPPLLCKSKLSSCNGLLRSPSKRAFMAALLSEVPVKFIASPVRFVGMLPAICAKPSGDKLEHRGRCISSRERDWSARRAPSTASISAGAAFIAAWRTAARARKPFTRVSSSPASTSHCTPASSAPKGNRSSRIAFSSAAVASFCPISSPAAFRTATHCFPRSAARCPSVIVAISRGESCSLSCFSATPTRSTILRTRSTAATCCLITTSRSAVSS
mmetsp:Transcript_48632/g.128637  ORF Transcript_48632/g.128637 Transcript_48632/m.128637 type:complete len:231 (-) Transcript_48632:297-989(-)